VVVVELIVVELVIVVVVGGKFVVVTELVAVVELVGGSGFVVGLLVGGARDPSQDTNKPTKCAMACSDIGTHMQVVLL
jgi:hypothetical protein